MRMQPAWEVSYDVEGRRAGGVTKLFRFTGTRATSWFRLVGLADDEGSEAVARLTVTSWHPYEKDALQDALRAAHDVCNVLSVACNNQIAFEPLLPAEVERLEGAKEHPEGGSGSSSTITLSGSLDSEHFELAGAGAVHDDPSLRADLDTWRLAMLETDAPTRLLHYFRIYEREAQTIVSDEPLLLSSEEVDACVEALAGALPSRLDREERARVESAVRRTVSAIRKRSRAVILAEHLSAQLEREVTPQQITALDKARGRYAHRASELEARSTAEEELLRDSTLSLLRRTLAAAGDEADHGSPDDAV